MTNIDGKTVFDEDAELYDRARPSYPEQLIEDVISFSGIPPGGRILEIGCGPGKATCDFARRGYSMLCIEPGPNLARLTLEKCSGYPVQVEVVSFEDWPVQESSFDLAISASAFHWLDTGIRVPKTAKTLKPAGTIALFWNGRPVPVTEVYAEINRVYQEHAPDLARDNGARSREGFTERRIRPCVEEIDASGLFGPVTVKTYPWSRVYTAQEYVDLMNTHSRHRALPADTKRKMHDAILRVIADHGGTVVQEYVSRLCLARKA